MLLCKCRYCKKFKLRANKNKFCKKCWKRIEHFGLAKYVEMIDNINAYLK